MKLVAIFVLAALLLVSLQAIGAEAAFPTITILSPTARMYNTTNILIDVQTSISANVSFSVNSGVNMTLFNNTNNANRSSVLATAFVEGTNTLKVFATDGNDTSISPLTITVDKTAPTLTIRTPTDGAVFTKPSVHFEFVPKDDRSASLSCILYINNAPADSVDVPSDFRASFDKLLVSGSYSWKVSCSDAAGNVVSTARTFVVQPSCGVFVRNLTIANNNTISFLIENTGTINNVVDYSLKVNLQKVLANYTKINITGSSSIEAGYNFGFDVYQIEAEAKADCGSINSEKLGYSKSPGENTACILPTANHTEIKCDTNKRALIQCQNGLWNLYTKDPTGYCISCGHCGDGIINCDETQTNCPQDFGMVVNCNCDNRTVVVGLTPKTGQDFYTYCKGSCNLGCLADSDCQTGYQCVDYGCSKRSGSCTVSIRNFDYTKQVSAGQEGYLVAGIKNTGVLNGSVTVKFYLDNIHRGTYKIPSLLPGQENGTSFYFTSNPGQHNIQLEALSDCGALDKENGTVNVYSSTTSSTAQQGLLITEANLTRSVENTTVGKGTEFSLRLLSTKPQVVKISVKGVPEEWLDYPKILGVENDRGVRIFVEPKEIGDYNLTISVEGKEETFTLNSNLKVLPKPPEKKLETHNIALIIVVLIAIFSLVVFLGAWVFRHSGL